MMEATDFSTAAIHDGRCHIMLRAQSRGDEYYVPSYTRLGTVRTTAGLNYDLPTGKLLVKKEFSVR